MSSDMSLEDVNEMFDGGIVQIEFNPRIGKVVVPSKMVNSNICYLNFSYKYWPHDLLVDEVGVGSTLQFSGEDVWCFVPWAAMYTMTGFNKSGEKVIAIGALSEKRQRPKLRLIKGGKS